MTAICVEGDTPLQAWKAGVAHLLQGSGEAFHVFTTVHNPCAIEAQWLRNHSPKVVGSALDNIHDVVDTIFPYSLSQRAQTREEFYSEYLRVHDRAMRWRRNRTAWGTYFQRLVRFPPDGTNQLERAILKLRTWPRNTTGLVFHLSSPAIDAPRTRGGPCWHFGELLWRGDGTIDFAVVYRNHDFLTKAFGNFVALGQLLAFICAHGQKTPGKLVCHSMHAYNSGSRRQLGQLAA
jgi:hypothetical protein